MNKINRIILILVVFLILLIAIFRFSENNADFSTYNPDWNGGMQIRSLVSGNHTVMSLPGREGISSLEPDKSVFIILGPGDNISEKDKESVKKFVDAGGLLILADDFGTGNQLLNRFTTSVSFSNLLLMDDVSFWKNSTFSVATANIENVSNITLNYPASLLITDKSVNVLASSSRFSWLSANESIHENIHEKRGSYPLIADIPSGHGKLVLISDPSIFINSMLPMQDNKLLLEKLVAGRIYVGFDETGRTPPIPAFDYLIRTNTSYQYLFALMVISLAFIYIKRDKISKLKMEKTVTIKDTLVRDEESIIKDILKRHDWDKRKFMLFRNKIRGKQ
ncbi:Uncharacterised protein [uncultured archaeon]|nr:Uncharacterised protein [uncultured archaeon]